MKQQLPEQFRAAGEPGEQYGAFKIPRQGKKTGHYFTVIVSDGMGWDHVSVSIPTEPRCPTWEEMCYIKGLFFDKDETVVQYHPAEADYVNNHQYCLHLWRPQAATLPKPDALMVGLKTV